MAEFLNEFSSVFAFSLAQSLLSASIAILVGFLGAFGIVGFRQGMQRRLGEVILLLPGLLPALFVILATLNIVGSLTTFPFGIYGVVIAHVLANFGIIAVVLARALETKLGGVIEIATIEGASKWRIIWQCVRGLKGEATGLFFFLFVVCFTSFSIPLVLGARTGATIEVLIYREFIQHAAIKRALLLAGFEAALVFMFSLVLSVGYSQNERQPRFLRRVFLPQALFATLFISVVVIAGSLHGLSVGLKQLLAADVLKEQIFLRFMGTIFEAFAVSLLTGMFFVGVFLLSSHKIVDRILAGYVAPSLVFTGFAIYLLIPVETLSIPERLVVISVGFAVLILPSLYRLRGRSMVKSLEGQMDIARIEGAGAWLIFRQVVWPQRARELMWVCGLAAVWASGDFAFATLIAGRDITLALTAQSLMGGYRMELATVVTWLSLLTGGFVFFICYLLGRIFAVEN